ncbi:MAG: Wzz/FepE/Etk N-terminal domain-containing protein [Bacteroidetes bacterium]|nr:Wzz/FepE/Etk N-terminal domain-containing protein [Bacteroidota bacterium]
MTDLRTSETFWLLIRTILNRRWFVIGVTGCTAIAAVIISLFLSNWYLAETRLLVPGQTSTGLLSSLASGRIGGGTASLLGGLISDYQQQLAILNSRTIKENVVQEFGLIEIYDLADSDAPMQYTIEELEGNIEFVVDNEYNYLSIRVYDQDPQRAANMANFFVTELNRIGIELSTETARSYRLAVEKRYQEIEDSLNTVLLSVRELQQQTGILDLPTQGAAFMEGLTEWRSQIFLAELEFDKLLFLYGPNHSQTKAAQNAVEQASQSYNRALEGAERLMPVAREDLPEVAFRFADLQVESVILTSLIEFARPLLEEARLSEERAAKSVQVLDPAIPPTEKARPWRAAICVVSTLSGFMLSLLYVLASAWWKQNHALIASKLSSSGVA